MENNNPFEVTRQGSNCRIAASLIDDQTNHPTTGNADEREKYETSSSQI